MSAAERIDPATACTLPIYSSVEDAAPDRLISLAELAALACAPTLGPKLESSLVTPYSATGKKKEHALQSLYHLLVIDHDHDNQDAAGIESIYDSFGVAFLAYTTSTHQRPDKQGVIANRWKVLVPLAAPIDAKLYNRIARGLAYALGADVAQARVQQGFFAPNREAADQPYEYLDRLSRPHLDADDYKQPLIAEALAGWQSLQREKEAQSQAAKVKTRPILSADKVGIIDKALTAYSIRDLLEANGYKRQGADYLSPTSSSGNAGVHILEREGKEVCYSHHGESDPLSNLNHNGHALDAFDVLVALEYRGDFTLAIRTEAAKLDQEGQKQRQREHMQAKAEREAAAHQDAEPDQEEEQSPAPAFDNELPGRLADLQLAIFDRMRKPSALGAAMVALTVCGHLLGRRVMGPTNLGCNLQTIICAATGRGKDSLVGAPEWLMKPLGEDLQATIAGQFASRPALHEHLMQQPCTLASIDEVGHMLKAIGNPRDSHMHDLGGFIMELFSSASKTIIPRGRRKAKGVVDLEPVKHPHFSLVGATTPAMLGLALTSDMTAAGQLNRLLICCLDDWNGHRQKPRFNAAPGWWAGWANDLQANYPDPGLHGEPLKMSWTKDADAFFWSEEERRDDALEGQADMVQQLRRRDCEHALKIAQVVALADFKTEVTRSHLEWSFSFVDRLQWAVLDLCRAEGILQGSSLDAVAKTAADHLRKHGPKTEARLAADCRVFGATKSGDRAHVMRIMRESFGMTSNATGRTFKLAVR